MSPMCRVEPNQPLSLPLLSAPLQAEPATPNSTPRERPRETTSSSSVRKEVIRNARLEIIGYRQTTGSLEILWDAHGRQLGVYEMATKITRNRHGKVVGLYVNQLLQLL